MIKHFELPTGIALYKNDFFLIIKKGSVTSIDFAFAPQTNGAVKGQHDLNRLRFNSTNQRTRGPTHCHGPTDSRINGPVKGQHDLKPSSRLKHRLLYAADGVG